MKRNSFIVWFPKKNWDEYGLVAPGLIGMLVIAAAIFLGILLFGYFMIGFLVALMIGDFFARKTGRSHRNCRLIFWPIILFLWVTVPVFVLFALNPPTHPMQPLVEQIKSFLIVYFIIWTPGAITIYLRSPPSRKYSGISSSSNNNPEQP